MHRRVVLGSFASSLSLALAACGGGGGPGGGGGGGGTPPPPPVITFSHTFPAGDAVAQKGMAWDIIGVTTTLTGQFGSAAGQRYDTLRVDTTFAQDISSALPAPGQPLSGGPELGTHVAINADGNTSTGSYGTCSPAVSVTPFEYITDQGNDPSRLLDGNYNIIGPGGGPLSQGGSNPPDEAVTVVSGHVLSQTFFLPAIGVTSGAAIPHIGISVAALNGADLNATDCAPGGIQEIYTDTATIM